jgi:aspartyl aminopeptidase
LGTKSTRFGLILDLFLLRVVLIDALMSRRYIAGNGFHIIGAHTDSLCLKLKHVTKV